MVSLVYKDVILLLQAKASVVRNDPIGIFFCIRPYQQLCEIAQPSTLSDANL